MTTITYKHDPASFFVEFKGHAGFAEGGKDIVCAAVSMLANEMVYACERAQKNGEIADLHYEQKSAFVSVRFRYIHSQSIEDIITLILDCLKSLEQDYHAYVRVKSMAK